MADTRETTVGVMGIALIARPITAIAMDAGTMDMAIDMGASVEETVECPESATVIE